MNECYLSKVSAEDFHPETRSFFKGKQIAVTGGTGFIGSHLVEQLLSLSAFPVVLTRQKNPRFLSHLKNRVKIVECDLLQYESTLRAMRDCPIVLNLAAVVAGIEYNNNHPATIFQDNLQTFFNAIKAAKELRVERFLVTSSACVYPRNCSIPTPEAEGFLDEPEPTNSGYGWSKRMEEYLARKYSEEYGLSVAIGRPYNAYGPRDNFHPKSSHVIPALILKAFNSKDGTLPVWGDGTHSRSFLYVDDFARGLIEVAARFAKAEPINIGAFEEVSIRDTALMIANLVSAETGRKLKPVFFPSGITGQPRRMCDTTKLVQQLQFEASVSINNGLKMTVEWFKGEYEKNCSLYSDT
jgi:GDP-L-fucose synthase